MLQLNDVFYPFIIPIFNKLHHNTTKEMLSIEKLRIKFYFFYTHFVYHVVFWYLSLGLYVFLTNDIFLLKDYFNLFKTESLFLNLFVVAASIGFLFSFLDTIVSDRLRRYTPIRLFTLLRSVLYFVIALFILILSTHEPRSLVFTTDYMQLKQFLPEVNIYFKRFMVFFFLSCYMNNFFKEMTKRIGRGNMLKWFLGKLNKPIEEERIFMFIDMKASTSIAEKLQHKKFSYLVQDIFNDMSVIENYFGDIYQYLGDGAIISWTLKKGMKNNNFLRGYFAFTRLIERKSRYYQRRYGLKPQFKAGLHFGKIMVLQVGRIRRDISYNGDTLNTTARIESMCNEYKQNLLISGNLYDLMTDYKDFNFKNIGNIKLKGKRKGVDIYQVKELG